MTTIDSLVVLDIDGVLNNDTSAYLATVGYHPPVKRRTRTMDKGCVQLFKQLLLQSNSKFIISSTWREDTVEESSSVFDALSWAGFEDARSYCVGVTPKLREPTEWTGKPYYARGTEIDTWLKGNPTYTNYVILDDDSFDIYQKDRFVHTEHAIGFTVKDMFKAMTLLGFKDEE